MLGLPSLDEALEAEPREMASVSPELWSLLRDLHRGGAFRLEFQSAWSNGSSFLNADDGLRGRRPRLVEWKGATKAPGDEVVPADLRVDHVYFVSCKYLSRIVMNASPAHLFGRLLTGGHGSRSEDWYQAIAPNELQDLYECAGREIGQPLPARPDLLSAEQRVALAASLRGRWPAGLREQALSFSEVVAQRTADTWREALARSGQDERMVWRLLRIGSAPYFVLGSDGDRSLRLRIHTPWDWRQAFRLLSFEVGCRPAEQPIVTWAARVEERRSRAEHLIEGHVEVRWAHGKFKAPPEAKVYLDTPHHRVPGYVPLG
jgi:hypothetical protein